MEISINKKSVDYFTIHRSVIRSRHSNSTKYNVYVKYRPNSDSFDGIECWYFTCKTGMRTVGCWLMSPSYSSHVASIIYFLSYRKYLGHITKSSSKLTSIFPDSDYHICQKKKTISSSKRKKNSREKQIEKDSSLSLSEKGLKNCDLDTSNDFFSECEFSNDCFSDSEVKIQVDEKDVLNESLKRLLSIDTEEINPSKRVKRT